MANINESIVSKVESMIETKKKPEKVFNNNPPKKEVVQRSNQDDNLQRTQGWNTHFNAKYVNNKNPSRQEDSPNRRPYQSITVDQTLDSSSIEYNTGALRMIGRQMSAAEPLTMINEN